MQRYEYLFELSEKNKTILKMTISHSEMTIIICRMTVFLHLEIYFNKQVKRHLINILKHVR